MRTLKTTIATTVFAVAARDLAIAGLDDRETAAAAIEPLLRDRESQVRGEAALTLGTLGAAQHVDAIGKLLSDGDQAVRQYAVMALGEIGDEAAMHNIAGRASFRADSKRARPLIFKV